MNPKPYICRHIFTDGHQCGSPALRGEKLCFYHHSSRRPATHQTIHGFTVVALPDPDDLHAVQRGLAEVLRLACAGSIDTKQTAVLLRGLATASSNLARIDRKARAAAREAARTGITPHLVDDFIDDPLLGTIACGPSTAEAASADPDPRPEGPLPNIIIRLTPEPELQAIRSPEAEAAGRALWTAAEAELAAAEAARALRPPTPAALFLKNYIAMPDEKEEEEAEVEREGEWEEVAEEGKEAAGASTETVPDLLPTRPYPQPYEHFGLPQKIAAAPLPPSTHHAADPSAAAHHLTPNLLHRLEETFATH